MPNNAAPGSCAYYMERFEIENNLTRNILKAIPPDKLAYRPHERSPSTGQIAWTIVRGLHSVLIWAVNAPARHLLILIQTSRKYSRASRIPAGAMLHNWSPGQRNAGQESASLRIGDRVAVERPAGDIVRLFHFDAIHHRGQLSTYLRPMGAKVPSIYGTSGDSGL